MKRVCQAINRAGERCGAAPLVGTEYCSAHNPVAPASTRFGSPEQATRAGVQGGRPPNPRVTEVMRHRVEEQVEAVLRVYFDALTSPDEVIRLRAAEALLDRVYGKAKEEVALTGEGGGPIELEQRMNISDPETRRLAHQLLARRASGA